MPTMQRLALLDLPLDLLCMILDQTVILLGLKLVVRLRLVNSIPSSSLQI